MAVPSNTYKTYEAVGIKESLEDIIYNISPVDTIFSSKLKEAEAKPNGVKYEWQTDALAAAASNAQLEGDDTAASAASPTTRLYNMMQIQKKAFRISGTMDAVKAAGRAKELAYQTAKNTKELAKDIEYAFLREVRVDGDAATARKMRGALNWITTNLNKAADATLNADGTITGGTARALTEAILNATSQNVFTEGGNPTLALCGPFQKRQVSAFTTGTVNYRRPVEEKKIINTVDVYVNDFFTLTIKPHRIMPTDVMVILDMDYWKKATLRPTAREELAKTGDSELYHIIAEHTLVAGNEKASGRITNLTTS